ncbi:MAG: succinylglutamate desuccinylase/aspartoacylase family protein [Silvanigrellaceae bacterium]|nr:succinylglutamate desuccinylase/aspartoacylase family protein [Silvanigrellaceae bacterium]
MSKLLSFVQKYSEYALKYPGLISDSITLMSPQANQASSCVPHVIFSGLVHGDEVGTLPAFLRIIESFEKKKLSFSGKVSFVVGNKEAALQGKRFVEQDLNRSFAVTSAQENTLEGKRAKDIVTFVQDCSLLVDFHQTIQPTLYPFYTFAFHWESYLWAQSLGGTNKLLTRNPQNKFSSTGLCFDEYVRSQLNRPALTLELGQRGFHAQSEDLAFTTIKKAIEIAEDVFFHKKNIEKIAQKNPFLEFYESYISYPFSHPQMKLLQDFSNFQKILAGEVFAQDEKQQPIAAPLNSYAFFPKLPLRDSQGNALGVLPGELIILARKQDHQSCDYLKEVERIL